MTQRARQHSVRPARGGNNAASRKAAAARRERHAQATRDDILEAALRAFAARGFVATTMRDIAAEAGYTAGALYSYFPSKGAIIAGLLEMLVRNLQQTYEDPTTGETFEEKLIQLLERQFEMQERRRTLFTMLIEVSQTPEVLPEELRQEQREGRSFRLFLGMLTSWVEKHSTKAERGGHDAAFVASLVLGCVSTLWMEWMMSPDAPAMSGRAAVIVHTLIHGVNAGPAKKRRPT